MKILLSIINADVLSCKRHDHASWEMVYRLSGSSNTTIGKESYLVSKGDLYLVPPRVYHFDTAREPFSDLIIHFDFLDFSDVLLMHDCETHVDTLAHMIYQIMNERETGYQSIADSLAEALLQYIKRFSLSSSPNPLAYKLKRTILNNIENSSFDLAREMMNLGYHSDYIRRCFKAAFGKPPLVYLTELRVERAKQLLIVPIYESIAAVCAKCGFADPFYFSTCFKKHVGISPLQYRKRELTAQKPSCQSPRS